MRGTINRGSGAPLGVSAASLTSRVPVRQPCRRSNHQLWFLAGSLVGSLVRASDAPLWSRWVPIPVSISARHVHGHPRSTDSLSRSHGQGFHWFPTTSDPAPTASLQLSYRRCSPCIRVAVFNLCSSGVSDLVSPYVCLWKDEAGVVLALGPDLFPSSPVPTSAYQLRMFVSWLAQSLSAVSVDARHLAPTAVDFCQAIHHRGLRLCFKFSQPIRLVPVILSTSVLPVHIDVPSWLFAPTSPIVGLSPARSWCG